MLRTAVVLASLGVLLLVGSFFMPKQQAVREDAGWVTAAKAKTEEFLKSHFGQGASPRDPEAKPAIRASRDGARENENVDSGLKAMTPLAADEGQNRGGGETHDELQTAETSQAPAQDEVPQGYAAHEGEGPAAMEEASGIDAGDEDAETATEVLERVGRKIKGRRG